MNRVIQSLVVAGMLMPAALFAQSSQMSSAEMDKLFKEGVACGEAGDYGKAVEIFQKLANQGHAEAQLGLGGCYAHGFGVPKDMQKAKYWLQKAADQGNKDARRVLEILSKELSKAKELFNKGVAYYEAKDYGKAAEIFQKLANQGHAGAQLYLGMCYWKGTGVPKDLQKAKSWLQKAADQGNEKAWEVFEILSKDPSLQSSQMSSAEMDKLFSEGEACCKAKDYGKALEIFQKLANQGHAKAQLFLGGCYAYGFCGVPKDMQKAVYWWEKSASQGFAEAQLYLGMYYLKGNDVTQDLQKAKYWLQKAADQGNTEARRTLKSLSVLKEAFNRGVAYYEAKDYKKAVESFCYLASMGDAEAQFYLGRCYWEGTGVPKNMQEAKSWLQKAADQGNTEARRILESLSALKEAFNKGVAYYKAKDYGKAAEIFQKLANQEYVEAQLYLGMCYGNGTGVPKDLQKAKYLLQKAADQGYEKAWEALEILSKDSSPESSQMSSAEMDELFSEGETRYKAEDYKMAAEIFQELACQGYAKAQFSLGGCYRKGTGVPFNVQNWIYWWEKAANQGYAEAQVSLGWCYREGFEVPRDMQKAAYWWEKAANQGHAEAQVSLGMCYMEDSGVPKDLQKAKYWLQKAADQGEEEAQRALEKLSKE